MSQIEAPVLPNFIKSLRLIVVSALLVGVYTGSCKSSESASPGSGHVQIRMLEPGIWEDVYTQGQMLEAFAFEITVGDDADLWLHYRSPNQNHLHELLGERALRFEEKEGLRTEVRRGQKVVVFVQSSWKDTSECTRGEGEGLDSELGMFQCHSVSVGIVGVGETPGYYWMYSFFPAGGTRGGGAPITGQKPSVNVAAGKTISLYRSVTAPLDIDEPDVPATGDFVVRIDGEQIPLSTWNYSAWELLLRVDPKS